MLFRDNLGTTTPIWQAENYDGIDRNVWQKADIAFDQTEEKELRLIIEATVGYNNKGDIALDDFSFTPDCK